MSNRDKLGVVLVPKNWTKLEMVELKHPKTEKGQLFAFNEDHSQIKEVTCVNEAYGSWFIGDTIETDGRLQMLADFDPLLLIIPYLRASERPMPLDHVLNDDDFPYTEYLVNVHSKMDQIANSKGSSDLNVWVWDEEKTLKYLTGKTERLTKEILAKGLTFKDNTSSTNFVSSKSTVESQEEDGKKLAWEFLSDFLQNDLSLKLAKHLSINLETPKPAEAKIAPKSAKVSENSSSTGPKDDFSKGFKTQKNTAVDLSTKQKALAKSAKGSKNISSFFTKK